MSTANSVFLGVLRGRVSGGRGQGAPRDEGGEHVEEDAGDDAGGGREGPGGLREDVRGGELQGNRLTSSSALTQDACMHA